MSGIEAVRNGEGVEDRAEVGEVEDCLAFVEIDLNAVARYLGRPHQQAWRDAGVVRMWAQRAREAVNSNEGHGCVVTLLVRTDEVPLNETGVGVEGVRSGRPSVSVLTCARERQIHLADETLEVADR